MKKTEVFQLTNESIDFVSENILKFLEKMKVPSKEIIKVRFKAEEIMHFYQTKFGTNSSFAVKYKAGMERCILFSFEGEKIEPFCNQNDEFVENIIKTMGEVDHWQYKHNTNIVSLKISKRQVSQILQMAFALLFVALFTLASQSFIPENVTTVLHEALIAPTANLLLGVLRSAACILIFTSITMGIINVGDVRSFRKMGKSMILNLFLMMSISIVVTLVFLSPWMHFSLDMGSGNEIIAQLSTMLFQMFPANPITPFIDGNVVQVMVLAVFCGLILSFLGERVDTLKKALRQLDSFISCAIEVINVLLPVLVFVVILDTILSNDISTLFQQKTIGLLWIIALAVQFVFDSVFVCAFGKMNIIAYFQKAKTPLMIALLTSSSLAALSANMEVCRNEFHIRKKLVDFAAPLGQVMFMPCSAATIVATCVAVSSLAGIAITPTWMISLIIVAAVLAIATPPIPGAALMIYSLVFAQMGLPFEYFGVTIAIVTVLDGVVTTLNMSSLHYLLLHVNNKVKID